LHQIFQIWNLFNKKFEKLRTSDQQYYDAFNTTANVFLARLYKQEKQLVVSDKEAKQLCLKYAVEEVAGFWVLACSGYRFHLYPTQVIFAFQLMQDKFLPPNVFKHIPYDFKKNALKDEEIQTLNQINGVNNGVQLKQ